jgi:glycosyltransferase involved in cell wall biosynthesis
MGGGGAERQVLEILKRLDRTRFEPHLYLANQQGELLTELPSDVPIHAYWDGNQESGSRKLLRWMKLTRLLRFLHVAKILREQKIDVVYDRTYLATLDAAGGSFFRPTPRISCCVVDPAPELELYARWSKKVSWWFARKAYGTASIVLANSDGLRNRFLEYFQLSPDHVQVFHNLITEVRSNAVTSEVDEKDRQAFLNEPNLQPDANQVDSKPSNLAQGCEQRFLMVTAGRLHPQKGHRILLQAVDELVHHRNRPLKLIIFGKGESEASLRYYVQTQGLEPYVLIAGFVAEPRYWYKMADLFVLTSFFEGMPNALIEAAACGLPILSTDCPSGPSEILDQGRCGRLVPVGDVQAIADAIVDAMDHPREWVVRAELAKQRVEQLFDPVTGIARLEKLITEIAQGRRLAAKSNADVH